MGAVKQARVAGAGATRSPPGGSIPAVDAVAPRGRPLFPTLRPTVEPGAGHSAY
ncbi:hypothetical protein [Rathayibacter sp. AY1E3]|uniref:hypothetical protein n=1 Tax=Rathayibacter sp. AY1E3 TaxID=2080551 RepID=UPI001CA5691F|nr:hypothetical protein [Rathayibacter sp. AY1E3]